MRPTQDGIATLTAPVAVRVLDVDEPLRDLHLSYAGRSQDYRSLLAIVRLAEDPIGVATFPVDCGRVTRAQLLGGVAAQLGPQLDDAYARRDLDGVAATSMDGSAGCLGADLSLCPSVSVVVPTCCEPGSAGALPAVDPAQRVRRLRGDRRREPSPVVGHRANARRAVRGREQAALRGGAQAFCLACPQRRPGQRRGRDRGVHRRRCRRRSALAARQRRAVDGGAAGSVRDGPDPAAGAREREPAAARAVRGVRQGL